MECFTQGMNPHGAPSFMGGPTAPEDFPALLRRHGLSPALPAAGFSGAFTGAPVPPGECRGLPVQTQATTILSFKFAHGVLMAGDRRATAGNLVVYDRADKVLDIDRFSLMAIAGVPATAWEMARVLEHSFQFYRRSQLQEMSHEGKVRALSKLLRDNLGFVMQGIGVVVPLFASYDVETGLARLYFYDAMGAQFEATDYAASGSGSGSVRSILHYENTWGKAPLKNLSQSDAVLVALRALDTAAETDTATGGVDRRGHIFPIVKVISATGIETLPEAQLAQVYKEQVS
jgi:proteasome beta subunit